MTDVYKKLYCSFCGKESAEVECLIAGPNIFICNECVEHCNDVLKQHLPLKSQ